MTLKQVKNFRLFVFFPVPRRTGKHTAKCTTHQTANLSNYLLLKHQYTKKSQEIQKVSTQNPGQKHAYFIHSAGYQYFN